VADAHWLKDPEPHDFAAAAEYLSLVAGRNDVRGLVDRLEKADRTARKAKDLLRAAWLPLLPADDPSAARDLAKVKSGEKLSPVLLIRGNARKGIPLTIADGYHRVCASYHLDEDEPVACRIVDLP